MHSNILLKDYTTMRLGGRARFMVEVSTRQQVQAVVQTAFKNQLNFFVLGGGSNIIAHDDGYDGIVMLNRIKGYDVLAALPRYRILVHMARSSQTLLCSWMRMMLRITLLSR